MKTLMKININIPDEMWNKLDDDKLDSLVEQVQEKMEIFLNDFLPNFGLEYEI